MLNNISTKARAIVELKMVGLFLYGGVGVCVWGGGVGCVCVGGWVCVCMGVFLIRRLSARSSWISIGLSSIKRLSSCLFASSTLPFFVAPFCQLPASTSTQVIGNNTTRCWMFYVQCICHCNIICVIILKCVYQSPCLGQYCLLRPQSWTCWRFAAILTRIYRHENSNHGFNSAV